MVSTSNVKSDDFNISAYIRYKSAKQKKLTLSDVLLARGRVLWP
jgi:hypothetical protein